uniref:NDP-hexose 3-ketoreductase n=1 Tax=Streptomyces venezuelae (strain ATCC 10712 / CBS 650.69 / DSM 40230 / JCM 4526 / NBRC 13096 / PD 04745) TaxID=953739 RepID=Q939Q8_STRVP|nr:NDP-hexose 3-ketoreductase [Streptomyces venezuelae ATCC 10712]
MLGCADIAVRRMMPAMAALPGTEVTAVASRDAAKAAVAAAPYGAAAVEGYQELLRRPDVDAVYVPLPAALHAEWTEAALRAGKHVLAEKPLTTDPESTAALLGLAAASGLALMETSCSSTTASTPTSRKLVADGAIGELRALHACSASPGCPTPTFRHDPGLGGGALGDVGVYPLRAAQHLLGDELDVLGAHLVRGPGSRVETAGGALLATPAGVTAHIAFGMDHGYRSAYELWGSQGRLVVERAYTPPADHRPVVRLETRTGVEALQKWVQGWFNLVLDADDQVRNTVAAFAALVARTGAGHPGDGGAPDPEAPLRQARLLDAVRRRAALV